MNGQHGEDPRVLECLRAAVREALDRKRRLGQYAVVWKDGKVTYIGPNPPTPQPSHQPKPADNPTP